MSAIAASARAQEVDFRDYFPQIDSTGWEEISQGCPIDHVENETLKQILYGIENIPEKFWKSAAESNPATLADAIAAPEEYCGKVFSFSGDCIQVPRNSHLPEPGTANSDPPMPARKERSPGLRMQIKCADETNVRVLAVSLPHSATSFLKEQQNRFVGQPVSGYGMFLFVQNSEPVLVSPQVHWRPTKFSQELNIGPGQLELAHVGFDVELLNKARNYTDMAIVPEEKELFDQMLIAADTVAQQPDSTLQGLAQPFDLVELVKNPGRNTGSLILVEGTLRRITSVAIDDPGLREAIGEDKYYQLDVFVPLGNKRIQLGDDYLHNPIEVFGEYGITIITTRLPEEILNARLPVRIEAQAFMLKVWEHTSLATSTAPGRLRRPNPILIAIPSRLHVVAPPEIDSALFILIPSLGFGVIGILGILFFVSRNRAKSFHSHQRVAGKPDFDGIFDGNTDESQPRP